MSVFEHSRREIFSSAQHPLKHTLEDFFYVHPALPGGSTTIEGALDYIIAVLYPQAKPPVATPGDLPLVGNTLNDYRVVSDDGDGKAAGYRWEKRETEASASWHKIHDLDWGVDSILQAWQTSTLDRYVSKLGYDDRDATGAVVVGDLAGQVIYGGATAGTNLTLFANSGDGTDPATGYVQFGDNVRPLVDSSISLGTNTYRFLKLWTDEVQSGTLVLAAGSITDTSGAISFGNENLTTTGTIAVGTLTLGTNTITDSTGTISFDNENLTTTGTVTADHVVATTTASQFKSGTTVGNLTLSNGQITDSSGTISFDNENLTTTGNVTGAIVTGTTTVGGTLQMSGHLLEKTSGGTNFEIKTNFGYVEFLSDIVTKNQTVVGAVGVTGSLTVDSITIDSADISNNQVNGSISLKPSGTGSVVIWSKLTPSASGYDLGTTTNRWGTIFLSTSIHNGTLEFILADLMTLRAAPYRDFAKTIPAQAGDTLFWDAVNSVWLASKPDTEIDHTTISNLTAGDAGHTQFVMLTGRAGGQIIQGGTAASQNLYLESTSHATKGTVFFTDNLKPTSDAAYSGGWTGTDIGGPANRVRHVYTAGEAFGFRMQNVGALPASSPQNIGRLVFLTSENKAYVDDGSAFVKMGANKYVEDTVWNGTDLTKTITVTTAGMDARNSIWALHDNTNDFEQVMVKITKTSATSVTITTTIPLPAGTYRLIGLE